MEAHAVGAAPMDRMPLGPLRRLVGDDKLVAAVRAGHQDAFETIFDRYHRQILSFCRHMLGSREESEDAVQATFLSAYRDMVSSEKQLQLRPWLYAIARNQCLSVLRARRESTSIDDVEPSVDGLAAEVQRRQDLREMLVDLSRLPDQQRAALVLSEVGALSHEEVAAALDCPRERVKALVFQARSSLAASRTARETPCAEIREQLATLSGGALRRGTLRRHVRDCPGCREFQAQVKQQRAAIALLLPVAPTAGLKSGVLSALGGGGGAAAGGAAVAGGGAGLGAILSGGAAKLVVAAAVVAGAAGGGVVAVKAIEDEGSGGGSIPAGVRDALTAPASPFGPSQHASSTATGNVPPGFAPTRARGEHAPGKPTDGLASGHNPKGTRGHSETAPGKAGTSPGKAGTSPGKAGTNPGKAGTSPGRAGTTPGQTNSSPSHGANPQRSVEHSSGNSDSSSSGTASESVNPHGGGGSVTSDVRGATGDAVGQ